MSGTFKPSKYVETDSILGGDPRYPLARQIQDIVHTGSGHYGIGLVCVTPRLANLNRNIVAQTNRITFFKQTSKADLKRLEEECEEEAREIEHKSLYYFVEYSGETSRFTWYRPLKENLLS